MITHLMRPAVPWAVCGAEGADVVFTTTVPTCVGCATGRWLAVDNHVARSALYMHQRVAAASNLPLDFLGMKKP